MGQVRRKDPGCEGCHNSSVRKSGKIILWSKTLLLILNGSSQIVLTQPIPVSDQFLTLLSQQLVKNVAFNTINKNNAGGGI